MEEVLRILDIYAEVAEDVMAMPVIKGVKTRAEKFAGALRSYSIEAMMQNGLALQAGTSHDLGQNFGKAFDVQVPDQGRPARLRLADQLGREHAPDRRPDHDPFRRQGPGAAAPAGAGESRAGADLSQGRGDGRRCWKRRTASPRTWARRWTTAKGQSPGAKFFHWERRGVPVVLELGPRDLAARQHRAQAARYRRPRKWCRRRRSPARLPAALDAHAEQTFTTAARQRLKDNTVVANSIDEVESILGDVSAEKGGGKFVMAHLKDDPACDARLKEFKATVRNIPLVDEFDGPGKCIVTGEPVERRAVIAKAY